MTIDIPDNSVWSYKGKLYRVNCLMKRNLSQCPMSGEWRPTVRYTQEPPCGLVFYRTDVEFFVKFERVP